MTHGFTLVMRREGISRHGNWAVVLLVVVRSYRGREMGRVRKIRVLVLLQKMLKHLILLLLRHKSHIPTSRCFGKFLRLCAICLFDLLRRQKESGALFHAFFRWIYPGFMGSYGLFDILKSIEIVSGSSDIIGLPIGRKYFGWLPSCQFFLI